jgi:hypothetical protein
MQFHLVVYLNDDYYQLFLIDNLAHIKECREIPKSNFKNKFAKKLKNYQKKKISIDRILVLPDLSAINTFFINITINPTDNFNDCLFIKLQKKGILIKDNIIKYKIIKEISEEKIEYLLMVLVIPLTLYNSINNSLSTAKSTENIQWVSVQYSLISAVINNNDFDDSFLFLYVDKNKTYLFVKKEEKIFYAKTLFFSIEELKIAMTKDGYSKNQIHSKIVTGAVFNQDMGFETKKLLFDTIEDLKRDIISLQSQTKILFNEILIYGNEIMHSDFSNILSEELKMPTRYMSFPDSNISCTVEIINHQQTLLIMSEALNIVNNMEVFLTYRHNVNNNLSIKNKKKSFFVIKKEEKIFLFVMIFMIIFISFFHHRMTYQQSMIESKVVGLKNQLLLTKEQYALKMSSLFDFNNMEKLKSKLINKEIKNQSIHSVLSTILSIQADSFNVFDMKIDLRETRIVVTAFAKKEDDIHLLLEELSSMLDNRKILLLRVSPEKPIKFIFEVYL